MKRLKKLSCILLILILVLQIPVMAAVGDKSAGTYARTNTNGIFKKIYSLQSNNDIKYSLTITNCTVKQATKIMLDFEAKYCPYYGLYFRVEKNGKNANIRFNSKIIKEGVDGSKKNASSMKKTLNKIVTKKMTQKQKATAIQKYVSKTLKYRGDIGNINQALKKKKGNCIAYAQYF